MISNIQLSLIQQPETVNFSEIQSRQTIYNLQSIASKINALSALNIFQGTHLTKINTLYQAHKFLKVYTIGKLYLILSILSTIVTSILVCAQFTTLHMHPILKDLTPNKYSLLYPQAKTILMALAALTAWGNLIWCFLRKWAMDLALSNFYCKLEKELKTRIDILIQQQNQDILIPLLLKIATIAQFEALWHVNHNKNKMSKPFQRVANLCGFLILCHTDKTIKTPLKACLTNRYLSSTFKSFTKGALSCTNLSQLVLDIQKQKTAILTQLNKKKSDHYQWYFNHMKNALGSISSD